MKICFLLVKEKHLKRLDFLFQEKILSFINLFPYDIKNMIFGIILFCMK